MDGEQVIVMMGKFTGKITLKAPGSRMYTNVS